MHLHLGILYKNGVIVNHRSLFKIIFNPIFRYFGFCVSSKFDKNSFKGYKLIKCDIVRPIRWCMTHNECDKILKQRTII